MLEPAKAKSRLALQSKRTAAEAHADEWCGCCIARLAHAIMIGRCRQGLDLKRGRPIAPTMDQKMMQLQDRVTVLESALTGLQHEHAMLLVLVAESLAKKSSNSDS